ncbi:GIY-YIG nuclease family protein [Paenibacillus sp. HJGM_3]|uniref:GIY-YIG nuclease family protein n=1 Tax=Paenibacillus sp. HJGM_3 TaxID=3379816 RepID=UPI003859D6BB
MLDEHGDVLYVGKAINLRARLASYFRPHPDRSKTARLVKYIHDIDLMIVTNENESLTLERELIKHYRPAYNRAMRRGPSVLPYIAVTRDAVPRLVAADHARFEAAAGQAQTAAAGRSETLIGPFPNIPYRNIVLEHVIAAYKLPTCAPLEDRLCLRYYHGWCSGLCEQRVTADEHALALEAAKALLADRDALLAHMREQMTAYAEELRFEQALAVKKQIEALVRMNERQAVNRPNGKREALAWFGRTGVLLAQLEDGTLRQRFAVAPLQEGAGRDEAAAALLARLWAEWRPAEIITNAASALPLAAEQVSRQHKALRLWEPKRGRKRDLLNIARLNLEYRESLTP